MTSVIFTAPPPHAAVYPTAVDSTAGVFAPTGGRRAAGRVPGGEQLPRSDLGTGALRGTAGVGAADRIGAAATRLRRHRRAARRHHQPLPRPEAASPGHRCGHQGGALLRLQPRQGTTLVPLPLPHPAGAGPESRAAAGHRRGHPQLPVPPACPVVGGCRAARGTPRRHAARPGGARPFTLEAEPPHRVGGAELRGGARPGGGTDRARPAPARRRTRVRRLRPLPLLVRRPGASTPNSWSAGSPPYPRDRFLVVDSETMDRRPDETFAAVTDFIGVERWRPPSFSHAHGSTGSDLAEATRARLDAHFDPHRRRLADLLGD